MESLKCEFGYCFGKSSLLGDTVGETIENDLVVWNWGEAVSVGAKLVTWPVGCVVLGASEVCLDTLPGSWFVFTEIEVDCWRAF